MSMHANLSQSDQNKPVPLEGKTTPVWRPIVHLLFYRTVNYALAPFKFTFTFTIPFLGQYVPRTPE